MKVISNTGPLIALSKGGLLPLLKDLFSEIIIPHAVYRELLGRFSEDIDKALKEFIHVKEVSLEEYEIDAILSDLDEGEKEVIGLAYSLGEEDVLLLMDDRLGREAAKKLGISFTGVVGVLLRAKEKGLLNSVGETLEKIRYNGYWLSDEIIEAAKTLAKEKL